MKKLVAILVCLGMFAFAGAAGATVIDFEDLYTGSNPNGLIPSSYAGFNWSSYSYWITKGDILDSGFEYGTVGNVSLYTGGGNDISMSGGYFDFIGAYITAGWNTSQDVTVEGWRDGSLAYSTTIMTYNDGPYWADFNFSGVDTIWFRPGDLGTSGHHIVIDNITFNEASHSPEPTTLLLFGSGLAGIGLFGRKRFRK